MPSPNSITDLVIFVAVSGFIIVAILVGLNYTPIGRKMTGNWRPGPIDIMPIERKPGEPREKYVDPLANLKPHYVIGSSLVLLLILFAYYFITKSTFQGGN